MSSRRTSGARDKRCQPPAKPAGPLSEAIALELAGSSVKVGVDEDSRTRIMQRYSDDPSLPRVAKDFRLAMDRGGEPFAMPSEALAPLF